MKLDMFPKRIITRSAIMLTLLAIATQANAASWTELSGTPPAAIYHDVYFVDANTGFIVGDDGIGNGVILRTTNGGATFSNWTPAPVSCPPLWKVFFYDSSYGWAVGDQATIKYTDDGGDSWVDYPVTTGLLATDDLRGVYFADLDNGWLASDHTDTTGNIYFQQGAATNWQMSNVTQSAPFHDIGFADFLNGWAVTTRSISSSYVFTSTNGGADFSEPGSHPTTNSLYGLAVVNTDDVWVVGDWNISSSSSMFRYNTSNWNIVTLPQQADLRDIDFVGVTSDDGWAVGLNSAILMRSGGAAWVTESTTASSDFEGIAAIDTLNAFAVGTNGVILRRGCTGDPECDDGLFCTGTETCLGGVCTSSGDPCLAGPECDNVCDDVADNCNVTLGTACTDDGNVCTDDQCDGTGSCGHPANSLPCDDGLFCNGADTCSGGVCNHVGDPCLTGPECDNVCDDAADNCNVVAGVACTDDGNVCTDDQCDGSGTCGHPVNSLPCDDGLFCNGVDTCSGGVCNHVGDPCLTGPECDNVCDDAADNCNVVTGVACTDDGNVCTDDQCNGTGTCGHPANSLPCDDGLFCNGVDTCSGGACAHAGDPCLGGPECDNVCDDAADNCNVTLGTACTDDGNVCTDDQCDGTGTCGHPANSSSCDDGLYCNGTDSCSGGTCNLHVGDPCLSGPECANVCDDVADNCNVTLGTACTDDGNVCTDDQCDGTGTCGHPSNSLPCDDGLFCNGTDTCSGGGCTHAGDPCLTGPECDNVCDDVADNCNVTAGTVCTDDGNVCTDDQCDGTGACGHPANSLPCDDGLFCNGADSCSGGACNQHVGDPCLSGPECDNVCDDVADNCHVTAGVACTDDGNVCTDDQCDGLGACVHPANNLPCDDGLFCTVNDRCSGGLCSGDDNDCSWAAGPCRNGKCNEDTDSCSVDDNKPAGTNCEPCGQCDGQGACLGSAARDGDECDDDDICTGTGTCLLGGTCQIEGWCDEIVDPDNCDAPAAVYEPDSPDCRFPPDKVELSVEVGSNIPRQGGFIPVRIRLANSDSLSGGEWSKPLWDLSVVLTLNPARGSSLSYLLGSALLQSGELPIEEMPDPNAGQVRFLLATDGTPMPVDVESADPAGWMLDLTLVYGETSGSDAAFDVTVMAPCGAEPDVVGCHEPSGWQELSETIRAASGGGDYRKDTLDLTETPALGCECGSSSAGGHEWLLVLLVALVLRRRRP